MWREFDQVANVKLFKLLCKLNSIDPDVKKGWSILGGPWTWPK